MSTIRTIAAWSPGRGRSRRFQPAYAPRTRTPTIEARVSAAHGRMAVESRTRRPSPPGRPSPSPSEGEGICIKRLRGGGNAEGTSKLAGVRRRVEDLHGLDVLTAVRFARTRVREAFENGY